MFSLFNNGYLEQIEVGSKLIVFIFDGLLGYVMMLKHPSTCHGATVELSVQLIEKIVVKNRVTPFELYVDMNAASF